MGLLEHGVQELTCGTLAVQHHDRVIEKLGEGEGLVPQRKMVSTRNEDIAEFPDRPDTVGV